MTLQKKSKVRFAISALMIVSAALVGAVAARAMQGGATADRLTYAGTLTGVGAGAQAFSFSFKKSGTVCSVVKSADVDSSGAFSVTFSSDDASCLSGFFDGSDVTVDVSVPSLGVNIAGQPVTPVPYAKYADVASAAVGPLQSTLSSLAVPPGTVVAFAGSPTPPGWFLCDGRAISRLQYASLFTAIGTAHGAGDGSTTFNLPDYQGRFLRGTDNGTGRDPDAATRTAPPNNGNSGPLVGSLQDDQFAGHNHGIRGAQYGTIDTGTGRQYFMPNEGEDPYGTSDVAGGSETRPRNAAVNWLIKF